MHTLLRTNQGLKTFFERKCSLAEHYIDALLAWRTLLREKNTRGKHRVVQRFSSKNIKEALHGGFYLTSEV